MNYPTGQKSPECPAYPNRKKIQNQLPKIEQKIASVKFFHSEIKLASFLP